MESLDQRGFSILLQGLIQNAEQAHALGHNHELTLDKQAKSIPPNQFILNVLYKKIIIHRFNIILFIQLDK